MLQDSVASAVELDSVCVPELESVDAIELELTNDEELEGASDDVDDCCTVVSLD